MNQNEITQTPAFTRDNADVYLATSSIDAYFSTRLHTDNWDRASEDKRRRAAATATRILNRLKYRGTKVSPTQANEFPRIITGGIVIEVTEVQTDIPKTIQEAFCELVYVLLSGVDPDKDADSLFMHSDSIASVKSSYDRNTIPDWTKAGIPSKTVWNLLLPYLASDQELRLVRAN